MLDLVGNPENWFSPVVAQMIHNGAHVRSMDGIWEA